MLMNIFTQYQDEARQVLWRWGIVNFQPRELRCRCGCGWRLDQEAIKGLQRVRNQWGPIVISSAFRCNEYNRKVGGATNSYHLTGKAFDIVVTEDWLERIKLANLAGAEGFRGIGLYRSFVHLDTGSRRVWGYDSDLMPE